MGRKKATFEELRKDALMYAKTIIENGWSCNKTAEFYGVSGSTVSSKLHMLKQTDPNIYGELVTILNGNFDLSDKKAEDKRKQYRRQLMKLRALSRPVAKIVKPANFDDEYSSISNRTKEWPNVYDVRVANILEPGKFQTFRIRANSPKHAKEIYLMMRDHYGYKYLSSNPRKIHASLNAHFVAL